MSLNTAILMGRLTKDAEIRNTQSGKAVARFTVAVDSKHAKDKTNFISCTAWGKTAEFIGKYFAKGSMICVEGEIVTGSYEKDGNTVYTTEVNVERVNFTGEKRDSGQPVPEYKAKPSEFSGFSEFEDDFPPF